MWLTSENRFKNYEAAYAQGLVIKNKDYGSIPSASQSTSSVSRIQPADSAISINKHDADDDDVDSEAGLSSPSAP
jgi:hypothetical protein